MIIKKSPSQFPGHKTPVKHHAFDIEKACIWITKYIYTATARNNPQNSEYYMKAIGEFSLLLNLSQRHNGSAAMRVRTIMQPVAETVEKWAEDKVINSAIELYSLCTSLDFLGLSDLDCSKRVRSKIREKIPSFFLCHDQKSTHSTLLQQGL